MGKSSELWRLFCFFFFFNFSIAAIGLACEGHKRDRVGNLQF